MIIFDILSTSSGITIILKVFMFIKNSLKDETRPLLLRNLHTLTH